MSMFSITSNLSTYIADQIFNHAKIAFMINTHSDNKRAES